MQKLINKLYQSPILSFIIPTLSYCLKKELRDCKTVLDLGCGPSSPLQQCSNIEYSVGVEAFPPYLAESKKKKIHNIYLDKKIEELDFPPNSFDAVIMIEVLEHLPKDKAHLILKRAQKWAKKKIIISSPNGFINQKAIDDNPLQKHLSGWNYQEMHSLGFKVKGLAGLKFLRQEVQGNTMGDDITTSIRFRPRFFWFIIATVSQIITYSFPFLAFELFSVKKKQSLHLAHSKKSLSISTRQHFASNYQNYSLLPSPDIKYAIYSLEIWNTFLSLIPDKKSQIIDFGCGAGTLLRALEDLGYTNLFGIDFIDAIPKGFLKRSTFLYSDLLQSSLESNSFDAVLSTMTIEHLDENLFQEEVSRVLKPGGIALITSVLKSKFSWYFYKNAKGETVIEPSHLKEYRSMEEFRKIFYKNFEVVLLRAPILRYPLIDPILRLLLAATKNTFFKNIIEKNNFFKIIRKLRVPIPGYRSVEIIVKKKIISKITNSN